MHKPLASIIVPLHNASRHVGPLCEHIKAQTYGDFEAIFVDGGPADETHEAFQRSVGADTRFHYLFHENEGAGAARNVGLNNAHGEFVCFIDADDTPAPTLLEHTIARAQKDASDIVVFQTRQFDAETNTYHKSPDRWDAASLPTVIEPHNLPDTLFGTFRNWPWDKLFRRAFLEEHALRFPTLLRVEDLAFTCQALACATRISLLDEELYTYTVNDAASSTNTQDMAPTDFIDSCLLLKDFLETHELMDTFKTTYTQWTGLACCVNLLELHSSDAFAQAYMRLHNGDLARLGLDAKGRSKAQLPEAMKDHVAAGHITNSDVWHLLDVIEANDLASGTFHILQFKHELAERTWKWRFNDLKSSRSYQLGNTLLTPLHALHDKTDRHR